VQIGEPSAINVPIKTYYLANDAKCDDEKNQALLNSLPGQQWYSTFYSSSIDNSLYAANNSAAVVGAINASLKDTPDDLDNCNNLFDWLS